MLSFRKNCAAVVCGASQGIGKEIAVLLASQGIRVLAVARTESKLKNVVALMKEISDLDHSYFSCDLSQSKELDSLTQHIHSTSSFNILICNSGGPKSGPLIDSPPEAFLEGFKNHVLGNQKLLQSMLPAMKLPAMKSSSWGRVVNILSTSVKAPIPNLGVSNTIRGAVAQWAKTLSLELGPLNITVNNVLPGYTDTERLSALLEAASQRTGQSKEEIKKDWINKVPLKRFASPQEIAFAVGFLCSNNADYISGINLPVDGGRTGSL